MRWKTKKDEASALGLGVCSKYYYDVEGYAYAAKERGEFQVELQS